MSDDLDFEMEVVKGSELKSPGSDSSDNVARDTTTSGGAGSSRSENFDDGSLDYGPIEVTLPEEWEVRPLSEKYDLQRGLNYSSDHYCEPGEGLPFYTLNSVQKGGGLKKDSTKHYDEREVDERKTVEPGDILIANTDLTQDGEIVGYPVLIPSGVKRATFSHHLNKLVGGDEVNTRYLSYLLQSEFVHRRMIAFSCGSTVLNLNSDLLKDLDLAFPPLPEQRKIASVLYTVDQAIQKTEEIIEQAKRVKRGLMQDLFETGYYDHSICERRIGPQLRKVPESWDVIGIGELAEYQNGYGFSKDEWSEQGRPIIRIQDLTRPEESDVNYFDGQVDEKYEVENGDILVSWSATLGVFKWNRGSAVLNQHIFKVRKIKEFVNEGYLYYALNYALSELERKLHGSTMKHVTRSAFENTEVPLPGLDEQKTISRVLGSVDEELRTEEAKKQNLEQVKKGLMQDLLTGEVRTADKAIEVLEEVQAHG